MNVEVNVGGDEQIDFAVAIEVDEGATRTPGFAGASDTGFCADIAERPVTVVVVQHIFPVVGDEKIFVAVIVVIADANALPPTGMLQAGLQGDVSEGAIAIV